MGLFDNFKKDNNWNDAYKANVEFFRKDDDKPFGVFTLTENTKTILPKNPHHLVDGKEINEYKLMIVSITKNDVIADLDYFNALNKLDDFIIDSNDNEILVKGLSLEELELLISKTNTTKAINKINDKELKEMIGNNVINLLNEGIDYNELLYTKIEFGYLYEFENHGLESLFKVITDKRIIYFAIQGTKILRLELNEELYNAYVDGFMKLYN